MVSPTSSPIPFRMATSSAETSSPSSAPTAAEPRLYAIPSARKLSVRCSRLIPTARAIPISGRRSAASMTKIRKISSTPAAIENSPKIRKIVTKNEPTSSPMPISCFFVSAISA